ncbi:MAG: hydroxyacid dehydrogenase [Pseudomonadota bacterium]
MPEVLITEFMDEAAVAGIATRHDTLYDPSLADRQAELPGLLAETRALIVRNRTQVGADLLAAAPALRCVGRLGVGLDNIDVAACEAKGVAVYPATGANDASVAEYVVTAALVLLRGAWSGSAAVAAGEWPRQTMIGREVAGKTLGLLGFGSIARQTATRARALGMAVAAHDPYLPADDPAWAEAQRVGFEALLQSADVLSLHVPLTDETRGMVDAIALRLLRPEAVVVNAARGGALDETALADALREGRLAGAALDVFETEPLTAEDGARFADLPNLILTPHIAGVTEESNVRVSALIAERVLAHLADSTAG